MLLPRPALLLLQLVVFCGAAWGVQLQSSGAAASYVAASSSATSSGALSAQTLFQLRIANQWAATTYGGPHSAGIDKLLNKRLPRNVSNLIATAVNQSSHVGERRSLAAAIHSRFVKGLPRSDLKEQVQQYAAKYREEFQNREAIFFNHISKSAGTTFCICGQLNGCVGSGMTSSKDAMLENCHADAYDYNAPDDMPHWNGRRQDPSGLDKCAGLVRYARENKYTLEANENYLVDDGLCPEFWNVIIMRDPIDRIVSHMRELFVLPPNSATAEVETGPDVWDPERLTLEELFSRVPILSDNFYIRSLLGAAAYELPFGAISDEHLEKAKRVLESFDLVLVLNPDLMLSLRLYLGWSCSNSRRVSLNDFALKIYSRWGDEDWQRLKDQNRFDIALVEHAVELFKLDRLVLDHKDFTIHRRCSNAECGFLCKASELTDYVNRSLLQTLQGHWAVAISNSRWLLVALAVELLAA